MAQKRQIELFSAGCPACHEAFETIQKFACPSCEVTIRDMNDPAAADRAKQLGVIRVPTVVIDGRIAGCCQDGGVDEATLRKEGVGQPL
jgi:glutaredoxin